jgi:N-acetylmuramoyl-L-alanine amidase
MRAGFSIARLGAVALLMFALSAPLPSRATDGPRPPLILAIAGRTCQIQHAVLAAAIPYVSLREISQCTGGDAQLIPARGLVEARVAGVRATLWPWGEPVAIVDGLRQPELPEQPWIWDNGRLLVSIEALEALTGGRIATRFRPEDLPIRAEPVDAFRQDMGPRGTGAGLRVLVDPGHGGDDRGTADAEGVPEKEITLAVGLRLAARLRARGFDVRLTREEDVYPSLQERVQMANSWDADLMLSIHCNSAPRKTARGIETYYLSRVASDPRALELASFENAFDQQQSTGDLLGDLLSEVARGVQEETSGRLAPIFHEHLAGGVGGENRGVRKAPFFVLAGTTMPAFLVELGFMSNPEDAALLRDAGHQDRLAAALASGVEAIVPWLRTRAAAPAEQAKP